jgi:HlyD family type I secretion membrane fusion protein
MSNAIKTPKLGRPLVVGMVIIATFFGVFLGWSLMAPLNSAAIAMGEVAVEGKRKTIAHLEGGIVAAIEVREGDVVQAGQVVVRLDRTQAKANLALVTGRYLAAKATEARLIAERDGLASVRFDRVLSDQSDNPEVMEMLAGQRSIFKARSQSLVQRKEILERRIQQYRAEILGLNGEVEAQTQHLALIEEEVGALKGLVKKGMSGRSRMLELQREASEILGGRARNQAAVARVRQNIAESELEINRLDTEHLNETVQELRDIQTQLYDFKEQMRAAEDVLRRTAVRTPIAGTIVDLQVYTVGGVVAPGEPLLHVVPGNERLIVEARVKPEDIDVVQPGLDAHVRFTAFNSVTHMPLAAKVLTVSADRLLDNRTGEPYYTSTLELTEDLSGDALSEEKLYPGMQAEVMIVTGARTPIDYLFEPLLERLNRAFRET